MVWFQCEDCGENLKKPKLANHFRMCSAHKLSCIDCGQMFDQQSVQSHTQCITEAEKYGPKGQGNTTHNGQTKPDKPKKNSDVDVNVGLSSHPPWFCSLCKTQATSKQTLLLHADGKKHRAKARAFHASQNQSSEGKEATANKEAAGSGQTEQSTEVNDTIMQESVLEKDSNVVVKESQRKRKIQEGDELSKNSEKTNASDITNGEVVQAEQSNVLKPKLKKKKSADETLNFKAQAENQAPNVETAQSKIKWKKIVSSTLKSSDGAMKIKKLQKLVVKALRESGVTENEDKLQDKLMHKINTSTKFTVENKRVHLATKMDAS